jgi:Rod binding domain-containing protein
MEIAAPSDVQSPPLPLEALASNTRIPEGQRLNEACRQFESVLLRQILAEGQKPTIPSKMNLNSNNSSIYHDMINAQMADQMSQNGGVGLARALSNQLGRPKSSSESDGDGAPKS